jgi:hypothetical protein
MVYRAPSGNFTHFLHKLDMILKSSYCSKIEFIICRDINVDYLSDNNRKNQLNSLLISYKLFSTVNFPTRIQNNSCSAIDNIFIDYSRLGTFRIDSVCNGLSDHDAQLILIHDINVPSYPNDILHKRKVNKFSLANYNLNFETWNEIFNETDVDIMFNSFLNTFLRLFYTSFP